MNAWREWREASSQLQKLRKRQVRANQRGGKRERLRLFRGGKATSASKVGQLISSVIKEYQHGFPVCFRIELP